MTQAESVWEKSRYIWNPRVWQLLREPAAAQYAQQVVSQLLDGVRIVFPETVVSLRLRVTVRSRRFNGRNLMPMIYEPELQDLALEMGVVALEALHRAHVTSDRFVLFGKAYTPVRQLKVALSESLGGSILAPGERATLNRLASTYVRRRGGQPSVLVHGDLHAGNLIVNREDRSLAFTDLEMMHIGRPATNFAQLWISFHFANPSLGMRFYQRYAKQSSLAIGEGFDADVRAEIGLRCHALVRTAMRTGHAEMEEKARSLLRSALSNNSFDEVLSSQQCISPPTVTT